VERYERSLGEILSAADSVRHVEDAWLWLHMLFELVWGYRFLYRDLNDLLSKNRKLETRFQSVMRGKERAMHQLLDGLARGGSIALGAAESATVAATMVVVVTYWLSFEYVRDPRHALEPEFAAAALGRGAYHALALLIAHLDADSRAHLQELAAAYLAG
jgi:hypothetical protein